jgi:hypothetical protein
MENLSSLTLAPFNYEYSNYLQFMQIVDLELFIKAHFFPMSNPDSLG